jgi:hypothetical protein
MTDDPKPITILDLPSGLVYIFAKAPLYQSESATRGTAPDDCDRPNEPCWIVRLDSEGSVEEAMRLTKIATAELDDLN